MSLSDLHTYALLFTAVNSLLHKLYLYHQSRGGGTSPADPASAGSKLDRNPQFKIFYFRYTVTVLINNESMIKTTT